MLNPSANQVPFNQPKNSQRGLTTPEIKKIQLWINIKSSKNLLLYINPPLYNTINYWNEFIISIKNQYPCFYQEYEPRWPLVRIIKFIFMSTFEKVN